MRIEKLENQKIFIEIPLTAQSGKTRVKERNSFYEYGLPVATKTKRFSQKHYVEWQIGYDVDKKDKEKLSLSTLQETNFLGANGKNKALYELSEYLYYFKKWNFISKEELKNLCEFLSNVKNNEFLDSNPNLSILRSHPINKNILQMNFCYCEVKYPALMYKFS